MRYAVIEVGDGTEYLQYLVADKNGADDLAEDNSGEVCVVVPVKAGCPIKTRDGIPVDDDGRPETAAKLAKIVREWEQR